MIEWEGQVVKMSEYFEVTEYEYVIENYRLWFTSAGPRPLLRHKNAVLDARKKEAISGLLGRIMNQYITTDVVDEPNAIGYTAKINLPFIVDEEVKRLRYENEQQRKSLFREIDSRSILYVVAGRIWIMVIIKMFNPVLADAIQRASR